MSVFIRRFLTDPGNDVLLEIESVNILDLDPPASITGVGTGTVLIVGEFGNGLYNTPVEVTSATDLQNQFGAFGYEYNGVKGNNPSARQRFADSAVAAEFWNGNAMIQLSGKKFRRLQVVRVDTTVGSVTINPLAFILGLASPAYTLTPGQTLVLSNDGGTTPTTATFNATAGTVTGAAGAFGTIVGGDTLILGYDAVTNSNITVTFLSTDTTVGAVVSRINQYAGFTFAANSAGQVALTGVQKGTGGQVRVVGGTAVTKVGLTVGNTNGTGNVVNIAAVLPSEVKTIVEAAVSYALVETQPDGKLRISNNVSTGTPTIRAKSTSTVTAFGFTFDVDGTVVIPTSNKIPAGTVVQPSGATSTQVLVTQNDIQFTTGGVVINGVVQPGVAAGTSPTWTVKVRHATDDGTGVANTAGTVVKVPNPISLMSFAVTNPQQTAAALSEAAIDAAYVTAINSTLDPTSPARECNVIYSARQSNAVRRQLRQNALDASANGLFGRMAVVRAPLGTSKAAAQSTSVEPGVGAYRDQRVIYVWPGANTFVPIIALRGTAGGTGFTASGNVDVGADGFLASVMSQLNPEENPGQLTTFLGAINSLDTQAIAQGPLIIDDYKAFKKAGICALRFDDGNPIFQSGVTSVDPSAFPSLVRIARRRMADFIQDSIARRSKSYGKKLSTAARRKALAGEITQFLDGLLGRNSPGSQRIAGYTVDDKSPNTPDTLATGIYRVIINVRTLSSLDSIVLATTIGDTVTVTETLAKAA